jgi:hypothetical protein
LAEVDVQRRGWSAVTAAVRGAGRYARYLAGRVAVSISVLRFAAGIFGSALAVDVGPGPGCGCGCGVTEEVQGALGLREDTDGAAATDVFGGGVTE